MIININPLGWNDTTLTRDVNKEYVSEYFNLPVPNGEILPFQISHRVLIPVVDETIYKFTYQNAVIDDIASYLAEFTFPQGFGRLRMECEMKIVNISDINHTDIFGDMAFDGTNVTYASSGITLTNTFQQFSFPLPVNPTPESIDYDGYWIRIFSDVNDLDIADGAEIQMRFIKFFDEEDNEIYFNSISASSRTDTIELSIEEGQGLGPYVLEISDKNSIQVYSGNIDVVGEMDRNDDRFYNIRHFGGNVGYNLENGIYSAKISDANGRIWYSEFFSVYSDISQFVKINYSSKFNLPYPDRLIDFSNSFQFEVYLDTKVARPNYEFIEEVEEKNGYKFYSNQVARKVYFFGVYAPEFLVDSMIIIRLCDFVTIVTPTQSFNCSEFLITPDWDEHGDIANCNCEFISGSITRKVNAFKNIDTLGQYSNVQYNNDYKNQLG